jgi:hypothetical protein
VYPLCYPYYNSNHRKEKATQEIEGCTLTTDLVK